MMFPSIFGENLMDDWFDDAFDDDFFEKKNPLYGKNAARVMRTDVRENDNSYDILVDLPGFNKEDIGVQLKDGYLNIAASKKLNKDETDKKTGRLIRQERYAGSLARSFYVGEDVKQDEIHAKYENGVLSINVPKKEEQKKVDGGSTIAIEG
ncbi:MAG: Hsp20/alpha crystallin family protein [Lachnospiraceae bacterium]|jgi:HSP20 family protein